MNVRKILSRRPMTVAEMTEIEAAGVELEAGQYVVLELEGGHKSLTPEEDAFAVAHFEPGKGWTSVAGPSDTV